MSVMSNVPSKLRGCAAAQYFRSAAHLISIDNKANKYVLSIFRADGLPFRAH